MNTTHVPTHGTLKKRPKTQCEIMQRRYEFAKASFAIEGLHLSAAMAEVFEKCIRMECSIEQMDAMLKSALPNHVATIRG